MTDFRINRRHEKMRNVDDHSQRRLVLRNNFTGDFSQKEMLVAQVNEVYALSCLTVYCLDDRPINLKQLRVRFDARTVTRIQRNQATTQGSGSEAISTNIKILSFAHLFLGLICVQTQLKYIFL